MRPRLVEHGGVRRSRGEWRRGRSGGRARGAGSGPALDVYIARCLPDFVLAVVAPIALAAAIGVLDWLSGLIIVVVIALFSVFGALVGRDGSGAGTNKVEPGRGTRSTDCGRLRRTAHTESLRPIL